MPIIVDLYIHRPSWIHRTDPRVKLLFVAGMLLLLLTYKNLFFMLAVLALLHLAHWAAQMPPEKYAFIWKTLLPVALLMTGLWVLFYPSGTPILQLGFVKITALSIAQGLVLGLRILNMAFVVFLWLYTTDQISLVRSLVKLKMPFEWALVLALALRYIPTFQGMYGVISDAQQARGLDFAETKGVQRVRAMMPIFVSMVISSLRASDQLAKALEARAFGVRGGKRTSLYDIHFRPLDYLYTAVFLALVGVLLYLRLRYGFGAHAIDLF